MTREELAKAIREDFERKGVWACKSDTINMRLDFEMLGIILEALEQESTTMTFEELKAEANRQGYNLVKKYRPMPKLLKCPLCGRKPKVNYGHNIYVACPTRQCLMGPSVKRVDHTNYTVIPKLEAERKAREAWNNMVENGLPVLKEEK